MSLSLLGKYGTKRDGRDTILAAPYLPLHRRSGRSPALPYPPCRHQKPYHKTFRKHPNVLTFYSILQVVFILRQRINFRVVFILRQQGEAAKSRYAVKQLRENEP